MGVTDDEPSYLLSDAAKETMLNVIGVDLMSLVFRGKFLFVAQVGSPQKAVLELRDNSPPQGVGMDILITGRMTKPGPKITDIVLRFILRCVNHLKTKVMMS